MERMQEEMEMMRRRFESGREHDGERDGEHERR
jgi:hypothetical protein